MKKILFIIQSYPSERSANVLCDERIMKALIDKGDYEVHCICYRYDEQPLKEIINGIYVHRWDRGLLWKLYTKAEFRGLKKWKIFIKINRMLMRIKQVLFIPIFPFYEPILALKFKHEALKLYDKIPFDIVIAEHNGLDTVYAGWQLKKKRNIAFMPIFWDSLSGGFRPKYLPKEFVDKRKSKLEERIVNDCDCAIMMRSHEEHERLLYSKKSTMLEKIAFLDIPYLTIYKDTYKEKVFEDGINIVFAGNMSMRDPKFFFKVLEVSDIQNITIHFFVDKKDCDKLKTIVQNYRIRVKIHSYIPHDKLIKYLKAADILLNFGVDNPNAISGKIFEYIGFMKPIISTYFIDNEAVLPVLKKYKASLLIDERKKPEVYKSAIRNLLAKYNNTLIDAESINEMFKNNLPEMYIKEIEKVLNKRKM